jgi:hypothetical protein
MMAPRWARPDTTSLVAERETERAPPERDAERAAERRAEGLDRGLAEVFDDFCFAFFLEIDFDLAGIKSYPLS